MAIIKATFTKKITGAKASVRYIEHRPGQDGARASRILFGKEGTLTRQEAYQQMDAAARVKRCTFYRIVISPDQRTEDSQRDLKLPEVTSRTMQTLEEQVKMSIQWVAAEHVDHAPHRHVHVVAVVPRKLEAHELQALRKTASQACLEQRQERDHLREQQGRGEEAELERQR